jgi:uncharacterized membrane protein (UPF0182 family)
LLFEGGNGNSSPIDWLSELEELPPQVRRYIKIGLVLGAIALLFLFISIFRGIYTDWLWFSQLELRSVFSTILFTRVWLFIVGFVVMAALTATSFWFSFKYSWGPVQLPLPTQAVGWLRNLLIAAMIAVGGIISLIFAAVLSGRWESFLKLMNSVPFGMTDPVFNKDVSFYVFTMPALHTIQGWLMGAAIVLALFSFGIYFLVYSIRGANPVPTAQQRNHLAVIGAAFMITVAAAHYLDRYETLFSTAGTVTGATYTDLNARMNALWLLTIVALVSGAMMLVTMRMQNLQQAFRWLLVAAGLWAVTGILAGILWPALVQRLAVNPSELEKEAVYIERSIHWTRVGFDLDRAEERAYPVREELLESDITDNPETINNIRLWDPRPLLDVYNQIQHLRLYYNFQDVDVDRYEIDGETRQVLLGTRELFPEGLDPSAQNWVNQTLVYTHGYGVVMSPATEFDSSGQPILFIQDVPPTGKIAVDQPRIYYGENTNNFVIVNSEESEFDRPASSGGDDRPVFIDGYDGAGGVTLSSFFRRVAYAWEFGDLNVLISGQITDESRVLYHRNIGERVAKVAPFLRLDRDPYMVVDNGRLFWIQDAYTVTDRFPYSKRLDDRDFNYIRNSVKVVVDAFNGTMTFYTFERHGADPIINMYQQVFPDLFRPETEMPPGLRDHIRYPETMLRAQASTYLQYHMTDPREFFLKEDQWAIPDEVVLEGIPQQVQPYYVIMKLPGEDEAEFVLILPFTPKDKPNLVAWMAARSDGEHYGDILVYHFPKDRLVNGPSQIEARIDNDPLISEQFTLWGQSGSIVIRGNLLVIPIGGTLLYAEPIYLQAETLQFPELKRVILVTADAVVMEPTLDEAVSSLLGKRTTTRPTNPGDPVIGGISPEEFDRAIGDLRDALDSLQEGFTGLDSAVGGLEGLTGGTN